MTDGPGAPEPSGPHVPLVLPEEELPLTADGRRVRAADAPVVVSPLRALAGAALAVAGVVLGIGALLTVTGEPDGSPALEGSGQVTGLRPDPVEDGAQEPADPADDLPAVAPSTAPPSPSPSRSASPAPAPAPARAAAVSAPRPAATTRAAVRPPVAVLNNSTRTGLADRAAARFARNGWPVSLTGNYRGKLRATTIYYAPGQKASAERFARTFRGISRVLPRPSTIPGPRGLVVVLTRDFPA